MAKIKKEKIKKGRKAPKTDGLGEREKAQLRAAIRQVWHRSHARKLVIDRCTGTDGFARCEAKDCKNKGKRVPKIKVDHMVAVGVVDSGFIDRMFVPSSKLQGLCEECHKVKTKADNAKTKASKKKAVIDDFF